MNTVSNVNQQENYHVTSENSQKSDQCSMQSFDDECYESNSSYYCESEKLSSLDHDNNSDSFLNQQKNVLLLPVIQPKSDKNSIININSQPNKKKNDYMFSYKHIIEVLLLIIFFLSINIIVYTTNEKLHGMHNVTYNGFNNVTSNLRN